MAAKHFPSENVIKAWWRFFVTLDVAFKLMRRVVLLPFCRAHAYILQKGIRYVQIDQNKPNHSLS